MRFLKATMCAEESEAYKQLDTVGKQHYTEKLKLLGLTGDPYVAPRDAFVVDPETWPAVDFPDICVYLIHSPSPYTKEALKAYKSTEAWAYFSAGYVSDMKLMQLNSETCLVLAKVSY